MVRKLDPAPAPLTTTSSGIGVRAIDSREAEALQGGERRHALPGGVRERGGGVRLAGGEFLLGHPVDRAGSPAIPITSVRESRRSSSSSIFLVSTPSRNSSKSRRTCSRWPRGRYASQHASSIRALRFRVVFFPWSTISRRPRNVESSKDRDAAVAQASSSRSLCWCSASVPPSPLRGLPDPVAVLEVSMVSPRGPPPAGRPSCGCCARAPRPPSRSGRPSARASEITRVVAVGL